ncbi:alpha/beta fold hydrolase [Haloarcula sp. AONF1]
MNDNRRLWIVAAVSVLLIFSGSGLAWTVQTDGGSVEVRDVTFSGTNGTMMSGTLYIPEEASSASPQPGVLAVHGYINSKETQSPFAIEYARRGFVVLAIDQTGHGYSDPPAFKNGYGGPDSLEYLRSLDYVDNENIGLEGHSMGGWTVVTAAAAHPDGYESMVIEGSSTGSNRAPKGTDSFPRNFAVVFSEYDEFSPLMWGTASASDVEQSGKLQTVFGTDSAVEEGRTYGSVEDGTARRLYTPATTHPGDHFSTMAIGASIEWLQLTLEGENEMDPSNQVWYWKSLGTFIALIGGVLSLFPAGGLLIERVSTDRLRREYPEGKGMTGAKRYAASLLAAAIPIVTYFPLQDIAPSIIGLSWLFPQQINNGVIVWALGNTVITAVLFAVWHYTSNADDPSVSLANYGLDTGDGARTLGVSVLAGVATVGVLYLLEAVVAFLFQTDFRIWVFAIKLLSPAQFRISFSYLLPLFAFFVVLGALLHGQLRPEGESRSLRRSMATNWLIVVGGFVVLLAIQYIPLLTGQPLPLGHPLLTILALQFVALLSIVAFVSTYFFRKTGRVWVGATINAVLVTWVIVAGTATQFPV